MDRLIALEPDQPMFPLNKALLAFREKADLRDARSAYEALAPSIKDDVEVTTGRIYLALCARDFAAAEEIVSKTTNEVLWTGAPVPRQIITLWIERLKGNHPTMEQFGAAREQLEQKVQADPSNPYLLTVLALADAAFGNKEEGIQEGRRALEMRPISEDALEGPYLAIKVAVVYAWANQSDLAFEQLDILIRIPGGRLNYGDLKTHPSWDPLRKDPRFDKLLAQLAPAHTGPVTGKSQATRIPLIGYRTGSQTESSESGKKRYRLPMHPTSPESSRFSVWEVPSAD